MNTTIGTTQANVTVTNTSGSLQNLYFTKFVSDPINQTSIAANTWTYNFAAKGPTVGFANFPVASTNQAVRIHVYVWRPSTGAKVGTSIIDGTTAATVDESGNATFIVCSTTFSGASVTTQAGDVIICEIWFVCTQQLATSSACVFGFDGPTVNTTKNATVTNHASFIETPENITFSAGTTTVTQTSIQKYNLRKYLSQTTIQKYNIVSATTTVLKTSIQKYNLRQFIPQTNIHKYNIAVIATGPTRFYLHTATDSTTGLPSTKQSSNITGTDQTMVAQTSNKQMNSTIGTADVNVSASQSTSSARNYYAGRFVSSPLNMSSISANTWTFNFCSLTATGSVGWPVLSTNKPVWVNCYVWRPSTAAKVGTIRDGNSASTVNENTPSNVEKCHTTTFSGSAVSSMAAGDVICFEVWLQCSLSNIGTVRFFFDGTTVTTTNDATVTNHASFLETPQTLVFGGGTTSVTQTSRHKYNISKYLSQTTIQKYNIATLITVLQTTVQKYSLRQYLAQSSIQKYSLRKFLAQTIIQKYNLLKFLAQSSIQKYSLRKFLAQTSIQKYSLRKFLTQSSIQKYNIVGPILVTTIQKYNVRKYLPKTTVQKYALRKLVPILTSIQKYSLWRLVPQTTIHKYRMGGKVLQTTTHKYNITIDVVDMTQTNTKTYANKFIVKV